MMFPLRDARSRTRTSNSQCQTRPVCRPHVNAYHAGGLRAAGPRLTRLNRRAPYMDAPHRSCAMASALSRSASLARHVCTNG